MVHHKNHFKKMVDLFLLVFCLYLQMSGHTDVWTMCLWWLSTMFEVDETKLNMHYHLMTPSVIKYLVICWWLWCVWWNWHVSLFHFRTCERRHASMLPPRSPSTRKSLRAMASVEVDCSIENKANHTDVLLIGLFYWYINWIIIIMYVT